MKALIYYLDFGSNQIWQVIIKNKMLILKIYKKKNQCCTLKIGRRNLCDRTLSPLRSFMGAAAMTALSCCKAKFHVEHCEGERCLGQVFSSHPQPEHGHSGPTAFKIKNPEAFDFWWKARSFPPCSCKSNVSVAMWRYLCSYLLIAGRFYFRESFYKTAGASGFQLVLLQHALLFQNEKVKRLLSG